MERCKSTNERRRKTKAASAAEAANACKVRNATFPSRSQLFKHCEKKGHFRAASDVSSVVKSNGRWPHAHRQISLSLMGIGYWWQNP